VSVAATSAARRARLELGSRLRVVRRQAGLTGRALAAATGWHLTRVSKIENGVQLPNEADIRDWCRACDADDQVEAAVAARMARQQVIYRSGKRFAVLLEEQALRSLVGTVDTQVGQLERLLALMSLPNVALGIIPLKAPRPAVASTGFWIFDESVVALETPTASIEVTRPQEVELHVKMFDLLATAAVSGRAARSLIGRVLEDLHPQDRVHRSRPQA
jgi:transcriptional regulator with XRE-family HTH domain